MYRTSIASRDKKKPGYAIAMRSYTVPTCHFSETNVETKGQRDAGVEEYNVFTIITPKQHIRVAVQVRACRYSAARSRRSTSWEMSINRSSVPADMTSSSSPLRPLSSYNYTSQVSIPFSIQLLLLLLHPFNGLFSRTTCASRYQKGKNQSGFK